MHAFEFSSVLPLEYLDDLEALLFLNPQQQAVRAGILHALEEYGVPRVDADERQIRVTVGTRTDVQTLYALADSPEGCELAGVIVYLRTDLRTVLVLHVAVTERFSSTGPDADALLVLRILETVRSGARRLKGVRTIAVAYPAGGSLHMPVRASQARDCRNA